MQTKHLLVCESIKEFIKKTLKKKLTQTPREKPHV